MNWLSFGGGLNSTALAVECVARRIPLDLITFADTGGERPETYEHVQYFSTWLRYEGYPGVVTITKGMATLEQECIGRKSLPSVVFNRKSCSDKFKKRPQENFVSTHEMAVETWARGEKVTKLIGFDADEPERAEPFETKKYKNWYPLIEWGMGRDECVLILKKHGVQVPSKSSCFFCPNMRLHEIRDLYDRHPDLFKRAIEMEKNADLTVFKGLDRDKAWGDYEIFFRDQTEMPFIDRPKSECGTCYDGK